MFELFRLLPLIVGSKFAVDMAKDIGMFPVNMLSMTSRAINWKKTREYATWLTDILNPNSNFFKVIDVGDGYKTVAWGLTHVHNDKYPSDCQITHFGQRFTRNQIDRMYPQVQRFFENMVKGYLQGLSVPQGVFDACVSVCYNTGAGLFKNSNGTDTQFYQALKAKDFENARTKLTWWKSGGQVLRGLVARRMGEHALFIGQTPKSQEYYLTVWQQYVNTFDKNLL